MVILLVIFIFCILLFFYFCNIKKGVFQFSEPYTIKSNASKQSKEAANKAKNAANKTETYKTDANAKTNEVLHQISLSGIS